MFPYTFNPNPGLYPLGYGVEGMGFNHPIGPVPVDPYPRNRLVKASFNAISGGVVVADQKALPVSLTGNGANLSGMMALQALANLQNQT